MDLQYANPDNPRLFRILPNGNAATGFYFVRWNPTVGQTMTDCSPKKVSAAAVQKLCAALQGGAPVHVDSELHAGGNARSVLGAALANTPNCWMRRIDGRMCLEYDPASAHAVGQIIYR